MEDYDTPDDWQSESAYDNYDPYDAMPFGDAIRFEENCLAAEAGFGLYGEDEDSPDDDGIEGYVDTVD